MLWRACTLRPLLISAVVLLSTAGAARAAVTQPPEPVDPSPINGQTYYLINQASGLQADLNGNSTVAGDSIVVNPRNFTNLSQRWAMTKAPSGNWLISDVGNGLCLDSVTAAGVTRTVQDPCSASVPTQQWTVTYITNGYNSVTNVGSGLALDVNGANTPGAQLIQSPLLGSATPSQSWLFRPTYFLGNDSSLQEKSEFDRVAVNSASAPWWHDGALPGQDLVQILKDNGLNMIRVRPVSINTTVVHNGVTFPITTGPYNNYTLAAPPASQVVPASANSASPGGTSSGQHAQTDWAAVDLAERAKQLGMAVNVTLFYDGDNTSETPGNWAGKTVDQLAGVPPNAGLMYNYVKQEMELFRANGAWPDLVAIGNEVNNGMFTTTGAGGLSPSGTNCTPTATSGGTGTANCWPRIQIAAMQAIKDAAADTSNPALLGPPLPPPLTCIHVDGNPDLQTFFNGAVNTNGIPLDVACESYYPGWHGPLTQAQQNWHHCNVVGNCTSTQHIAESDFASEANGLGLPIFTIEDGVSYTTSGSPQDPWYGVPSPGPSRVLARQGMIDLNKVEENIPNHLAMGMEWWAGEGTPIPGITALEGFWSTSGITLFDSSTTANNALDNATLPVMAAMGDKLDPTLAYKLVNAANGRDLETSGGSTAAGAALDTAADTPITGPQQEWQFLAQGADPEQNATTYPTPMDHRGDGFFQIANMNQGSGLNVLDSLGSTAGGSAIVQSPESAAVTAITGTNANQEWDILPAGNCGDAPANCTAPPLVSNGNGDFYVIVNKATGKVLSTSGTGADATIQQQSPAAISNGDWIAPVNSGQLWRIVAARITQATVSTATSVAPSANPAGFGQPLTLTATISGGNPVAGSTVTFKDGATVVGMVTLMAGQTTASISTSTLAPGSHTITAAYSGDAVNLASSGTTSVTVVALTTTASLTPVAVNGYYNQNPMVTLSATDTGGSGLATTSYQIDNGPVQIYSGPFVISGDGARSLRYWSSDLDGYTEPINARTVNVDTTAPVTTAGVSPALINGQVSAPAVITLSGADAFSGVAGTQYNLDNGGWQSYSAPLTITAGGVHILQYRSSDTAGNVETAKTLTFQVNPTAISTLTGSVPSTLVLSTASGTPSFGAFTPGVSFTYATTVAMTVTSTAATATLSAADQGSFAGHLVNTAAAGGPYALAQGLQVSASDPLNTTGSDTFTDLSSTNPATLLTWGSPVSVDAVTVAFKQPVGATDPLRTGTYSKTVTFTLSTTTP